MSDMSREYRYCCLVCPRIDLPHSFAPFAPFASFTSFAPLIYHSIQAFRLLRPPVNCLLLSSSSSHSRLNIASAPATLSAYCFHSSSGRSPNSASVLARIHTLLSRPTADSSEVALNTFCTSASGPFFLVGDTDAVDRAIGGGVPRPTSPMSGTTPFKSAVTPFKSAVTPFKLAVSPFISCPTPFVPPFMSGVPSSSTFSFLASLDAGDRDSSLRRLGEVMMMFRRD
ncbi:uncharacterized protein YALI1_D08494g [Yarrowia lipolytica]|uniref:Uncharacterized protein n=1 Tax=Yarrowia lipolytica TaxID=4952 RepID=A0A1D8NDI3_YARLL|nr:hypothetical protein YALI1_D08494g [Yarrowia lipolytica]